MRLTWRDGVSTLLVLACGAIFFAVTDAWGWPLLSSFGAGSAALLVVGLAACISGTTSTTPSRTPEVAGPEREARAVARAVAGAPTRFTPRR